VCVSVLNEYEHRFVAVSQFLFYEVSISNDKNMFLDLDLLMASVNTVLGSPC